MTPAHARPARLHDPVHVAEAAKPPPAAARRPTTAQELAQHVGRLGADRVADVLRIGLDDLRPLLEGRVSVAKSAMAKLRGAA